MQEITTKILIGLGWSTLPPWASVVIASLNVILILVLALAVRAFMRHLLAAVDARLKKRTLDIEERKRFETLNRILGYVASVVIGILTVMLILSELGISIAPLLATAGVAGIAISFGAQSLVKDYFIGFVMLIENQIRQDDFIEAAGKSGTVEEITLRYVRLRDGEGAVHYIPNGAITTVSNHSRKFAYAVVDIGVDYETDLQVAYAALRDVGQALRADPKIGANILGNTEILGVNGLEDSSITIRMRIKTVASAKWSVKRALFEHIKTAFDAQGIVIPFPQRVLHMQNPAADKKAGERQSAPENAQESNPAGGQPEQSS